MHRSRVYAVLIDTPEEEAEQAAAFWSAALGATARPDPDHSQFTVLHGALPGIVAAIQSVNDAPRYHVDIESDDPEAETQRLIALGATEITRWLDCRVLRAPGGHLLCVLPVHSPPEVFQAEARTWP
ncbi:VOC family protein [Streptomyces sp. 7-21]|uniref:VOC family protein n=1 Tax=Streptomyces sp. 7-21 TaxID=2802283 RepID=UPI00191EAEEE|nr:VOC family protein [Streptomyces sp. 7-21]MBL1066846.1 glyoxalase/bleomycin resistance/dioxygenase family protein [Streptomyces sp. 7-21]